MLKVGSAGPALRQHFDEIRHHRAAARAARYLPRQRRRRRLEDGSTGTEGFQIIVRARLALVCSRGFLKLSTFIRRIRV
jgi:predicted DNA-binding WGR domain protein